MTRVLCKTPGGRDVLHGSWWQHQSPKRPEKFRLVAYEAETDRVMLEDEQGRARRVARQRLNATAGYFQCTAPHTWNAKGGMS